MGLHGKKRLMALSLKKIDQPVKKDKKGYILEVNVEYPNELHKKHYELPFLAARMKIGKVKKLVSNLKDKETYVVNKH